MAMNDKEKKAITRKLEHPNEKVICPRCTAELIYNEYGNSAKVHCPNDLDIKGAMRGL